MAQIVGGIVQLGTYLAWAKQQGCKVESGYGHDPDGEIHTITRIIAPSGKHVLEVGTQQDEYLPVSAIGYLDRRLGLKSPFFSAT